MAHYEGVGEGENYIPPVDTVIAIWAGINNCSPIPDTIFNESGNIGRKWSSFTGENDIILYTNNEGEHEWARPANWGISATDIMWDFLKQHNRSVQSGIDTRSLTILSDIELHQNYPNPFRNSTNIKFILPVTSHVTLKIFSITGKEIATLIDRVTMEGEYLIEWQPKKLEEGTYLCKIQAGPSIRIRKLTCLK
jgi:hypothetical protein